MWNFNERVSGGVVAEQNGFSPAEQIVQPYGAQEIYDPQTLQQLIRTFSSASVPLLTRRVLWFNSSSRT